ncbi:MAG: TAT-variant-translocated molybdopterin oxidoreductase, partial [Deltaproteobacteria bacterium]|nr:TAT-variant-translocated molybdopterin oxidoreductase [Deltaproteobacteria bacterium]
MTRPHGPAHLPAVPTAGDQAANAGSNDRPRYWRSLGELANSLQYRQAARHVPGGVAGPADGFSRRGFLKVMGASMGLAGLAACRRPEEKI